MTWDGLPWFRSTIYTTFRKKQEKIEVVYGIFVQLEGRCLALGPRKAVESKTAPNIVARQATDPTAAGAMNVASLDMLNEIIVYVLYHNL